MSKTPFRCPECHLPMRSEGHVKTHREASQGQCFDGLRSEQRRRILRYRKQFGITPPPLPADPFDFDLIED